LFSHVLGRFKRYKKRILPLGSLNTFSTLAIYTVILLSNMDERANSIAVFSLSERGVDTGTILPI